MDNAPARHPLHASLAHLAATSDGLAGAPARAEGPPLLDVVRAEAAHHRRKRTAIGLMIADRLAELAHDIDRTGATTPDELVARMYPDEADGSDEGPGADTATGHDGNPPLMDRVETMNLFIPGFGPRVVVLETVIQANTEPAPALDDDDEGEWQEADCGLLTVYTRASVD